MVVTVSCVWALPSRSIDQMSENWLSCVVLTKAICLLSGDHPGSKSLVWELEMLTRFEPFGSIVKICQFPRRRAKAIFVPSGDQAGDVSIPSPVSLCALVPSLFIMAMLPSFVDEDDLRAVGREGRVLAGDGLIADRAVLTAVEAHNGNDARIAS